MEKPTIPCQTRKHTAIKICRVRENSTIREMAHLGVDLVGLHLIHRMSSNDIEKASDMCAYAERVGVQSVLVTKVSDVELLARAVKTTRTHWLQLHRTWGIDDVTTLWSHLRSIQQSVRLIHLITPERIDDESYISLILDSGAHLIVDHERGGVGQLIPRQALDQFFNFVPREKTFFAGGLTANNVADVIRFYGPGAVDVQSGVIGDNGEQSIALVRDFVAAVRSADALMTP